MTNLRVAPVPAPIYLAVQYCAHANPGAHSHIEESRFRFSRSPAQLAERGGVGVVFQGCLHSKRTGENLDRVAALPSRQIVHVAEASGRGVDRPGAPDPNSAELGAGAFRTFAKEFRHAAHRVIEAAWDVGWALVPCHQASGFVDDPNGNLGAANVNRADRFSVNLSVNVRVHLESIPAY